MIFFFFFKNSEIVVRYKNLISEMIKLDEKNIGDNNKYYELKNCNENIR